MRSKFFITPKLKKEIERDIHKRTKINEKLEKELEEFYYQTDPETIESTLKFIKEIGNDKQHEILKEIEQRFKNKALIIEDTLSLTDWYEKMCKYHTDND